MSNQVQFNDFTASKFDGVLLVINQGSRPRNELRNRCQDDVLKQYQTEYRSSRYHLRTLTPTNRCGSTKSSVLLTIELCLSKGSC